MRSKSWLCLLMTCAGLLWLARPTPLPAQDENRGGPLDRLDRLERRVNELAERQEHLLQQLGPRLDRRNPLPPPGPEGLRPPMPGPGPEALRGPMPGPEPRVAMAAKVLDGIGGLVRLCLLVCVIANILLAVWIYGDIRKRGEGPGIFIALALLAGVPAAIIYAIVRIGDRKI
ncbi:MAG: hypothetical protein KGS61_09365 [Verrucomicrobia bacterium]|nr:hypothetical protein [Verrucomicrobiota bacterium]